MIDSINTHTSTGSVSSYQEEMDALNRQAETRATQVKEKEPLGNPQNVVKTAQTASDIAISNNVEWTLKKSLGQVVIENSARNYEREDRINSDINLKRDVGNVDYQSALGSVISEGMPSAEVSAKPKTE